MFILLNIESELIKLIKLSKRNLIELAEELNASRLTGNVYTYENLINCLQSSNFNRGDYAYEYLRKYMENKTEEKDYIERIYKYKNHDKKYKCYANKIAYSCGTYGNTGQLHEIDIFYGDEKIETLFIYY